MRARTIIIWCALVPQRREKERVAGGGREQIQREEMAAGQIFEDEQDENKRAYFQHPERGTAIVQEMKNRSNAVRTMKTRNATKAVPQWKIVRNLY